MACNNRVVTIGSPRAYEVDRYQIGLPNGIQKIPEREKPGAVRGTRHLESLSENSVGVLFSQKRPDGEARRGRIPAAVSDRGATKPDGFFCENPPGGGSFVRGLRWLTRHSPLRGCSGLAALATAKIPRRRTPRNFQTGSKSKDLIQVILIPEPPGGQNSPSIHQFSRSRFFLPGLALPPTALMKTIRVKCV